MEKNRRTGECKNGLYLWGSDMIIIKILEEEAICEAINDLIEQEVFNSAFSGPFEIDPLDIE